MDFKPAALLKPLDISSSSSSRRCTKKSCNSVLPPADVYQYVQCPPCREKGRIISRAFLERKRLRSEQISEKSEATLQAEVSIRRSMLGRLCVVGCLLNLNGTTKKRHSSEKDSFQQRASSLSSSSSSCPPISPTTPVVSSTGDIASRSTSTRICTRPSCRTTLPPFGEYRYLLCPSCREYGRIQNRAAQERKRRRSEAEAKAADVKVDCSEGVEGSVRVIEAEVSLHL